MSISFQAIHILGCSNICGYDFYKLLDNTNSDSQVFTYSRSNVSWSKNHYVVDFSNILESNFLQLKESNLIVSFLPVWVFSNFIIYQFRHTPNIDQAVNFIIAVSSSSVITKKYSFSPYDKDLVERISYAEDSLRDLSQSFCVTTNIIRPTLIYGKSGPYTDRNISKLKPILNNLPFLILPTKCGRRQPIHSTQLAQCIYVICQCGNARLGHGFHEHTIGGDDVVPYNIMLERLIDCSSLCRPRIIMVSMPIYMVSIVFVSLLSIKIYAALVRICIDLGPFPASCTISGTDPLLFPVDPF